MRMLYVFILIMIWTMSLAQEIEYKDHVYLDHIKSVKFHHSGLVTSEPIIDLNSRGQLVLSFDDILGGDRNYTYSIVHCDKDWLPSDNITEMDYMEGFNDEDIRDYEYSSGTIQDYTNYRLYLPNDDLGWRLSGNYLLIIKDDESDEIAFTRRFMVSERKVSIGVDVSRSRKVDRLLYDQELEIKIDNKNYPIANPQNELFITVLQNGRWDKAYFNIQPKIIGGDVIQLDRTSQISFAGYNEFRGADLRSFRSRGLGIHSVDIFENKIDIFLDVDMKHSNILSQNYEDINGDFIIETAEYSGSRNRSEYVNCYFTIESADQILDGDVFIIGAFNDWRAKEEFRLNYNFEKKLYHTSGLLKQGYYDYQYVINYDDGSQDIEYFEGSNFSTQNQYHVLVYQRAFGDRYDRLIGVTSANSNFGN